MPKLDHQMSQEEREKVRDNYVDSQKPVEPEEPAELVYEPDPGRKSAKKTSAKKSAARKSRARAKKA